MDNVLLPHVSNTTTKLPPPNESGEPRGLVGLKRVEEEEGGEEEEEEEDSENGEQDDIPLTEEELLMFSRVVPIAPLRGAFTSAAVPDDESLVVFQAQGGKMSSKISGVGSQSLEDQVGEEEEEGGHLLQRTRGRRAPKEPGLGRFGKLKKGKRPHDPYGTEIVANGAMRLNEAREVATVSRGPASAVTAAAAVAAADTMMTPGISGGAPLIAVTDTTAPAWLKASDSQSIAAQPASKRVQNVGGAIVKDALPVGIRGGAFTLGKKHFPQHLLAKALKLQEERNVTTNASGGQR